MDGLFQLIAEYDVLEIFSNAFLKGRTKALLMVLKLMEYKEIEISFQTQALFQHKLTRFRSC